MAYLDGDWEKRKKKAYTALLQCRTFFAKQNGGHGGKISVVDMVFPVLIGFLYASELCFRQTVKITFRTVCNRACPIRLTLRSGRKLV